MVFLGRTAGNQDVILINKDEVKAPTNAVHKPLEDLCGISESEWHATEFEEAKGCNDGGLSNIIVVDLNLVIGTHKINFGEDGFASKMRCKVLDVRERIAVRSRSVVKSAVVSTWAPLTVLLHYHVKRRRPGT